MVFSTNEWKDVKEISEARDKEYKRFFIPKSSGGRREILAPSDRLKALQTKLLNKFLYVRYIPSVYATGFVVDRSIVHNAMAHVGAKVLVNVDVKDFFPTITDEMLQEKVFYKKLVRIKELEKMERIAKKEKLSTIHLVDKEKYKLTTHEEDQLKEQAELLTKLVTYPYKKKNGKFKNALPQGAPTSPALSNIVCFEMDNVLSGVAKRNNAVFTRYADDITFSSASNTQINKLIPVIKEILKKYGFKANEKKIRVNRRSGRMSVTGLVVNDKVSYGRGRLRIIRAELHHKKMDIKDGVVPPIDEMHYRGMAAYFNAFDKDKSDWVNKEVDEILDGIATLTGEDHLRKRGQKKKK
jgi:RNA-directed DNA polymerase